MILLCSNHPQMVYIHKLKTDFNISDIRESFIRQFVGQELNLAVDMQENPDEATLIIKSTPLRLVKHQTQGSKSGGVLEKRSGISTIVRYNHKVN